MPATFFGGGVPAQIALVVAVGLAGAGATWVFGHAGARRLGAWLDGPEAAQPRLSSPLGFRSPGPCNGRADGDGGAPVDGLFDSNRFFEYDAQHRLVVVTEDFDSDGRIDARATMRGAPGSLPSGEAYDCNGDGVDDEEIRYVRDGLGFRRMGLLTKSLRHREECESAGLAERLARGPAMASIRPDRVVRDWFGMLAALAPQGPPVPRTRVHGVVLYYLDAEGLIRAEEWDMDLDGIVEEVIRYVRDEHGNLMWEYHDDGPDGVVDLAVFYEHGCWANLEREEITEAATLSPHPPAAR